MITTCPVNQPFSATKPCIEHILYFVWERECIRIAKENKYSGTLTGDSILKQYRFCNVRRRDDRVSKWIIENMLVHADPFEDDIFFIAAIARMVNWPPTLHTLLSEGVVPRVAEEFDAVGFVRVIDDIKRRGDKLYGGAYMVFPGREVGSNKAETIARKFLQPLAEDATKIRAAVQSNSVEQLVTKLTEYWGWNTFTAGQVAADLTYTPQMKRAKDLYTWAPIGPGSSRGLNRLIRRKLDRKWDQDDFNRRLRDIKNTIEVELELEEPLTLHDMQNVMCEMDKYWRALYGEGAPRTLYKPETAF